MASYYPRILPPQQNFASGFGAGLGSGIAQGAANLSSIYAKAMQEDMLRERQPSPDEIMQAMKERGLEVSGASYNPESGDVRYSYSRPQETAERPQDKLRQIKMAMAGIIDPAEIGREMGIEDKYAGAEPQAQVMTDQGLRGIVSAQDQPVPYGEQVQSALMDRFAPGLSKEQVMRDVMGLPQPKDKIPNVVFGEIEDLREQSGGNQNTFLRGMEELAQKYMDNPAVLKKISEIMSLNIKARPRIQRTAEITEQMTPEQFEEFKREKF